MRQSIAGSSLRLLAIEMVALGTINCYMDFTGVVKQYAVAELFGAHPQ
jgi:hypothetical protein